MAFNIRERDRDVAETSDYRNQEVRKDESAKKECEDLEAFNSFRKAWPNVTDDNYLTLFGFRRFRTAHLLNLRFLEEEIDRIDHQMFQAGLKLDHSPRTIDRLGLEHAKMDMKPQGVDEIISKELVTKLRELLKQYGI